MKKSIFLVAITLIFNLTLSTYNLSAQENFKIVRGKSDTVYTPVHYIVGVAPAGSQIFVNDLPSKQYKTGSFGSELRLVPGDNSVRVRVITNGNENIENFVVYYKLPVPLTVPADTVPYSGRVVVTREGAYMNYGAGQDRLGGAKINYLAEGIRMELLDSAQALYKVRLSENSYAFIPKSLVNHEPAGTKPPFSLTSSWSVSNAGNTDIVRVALEKRLPYTFFKELEPNRIVIDIHGAACNSNWITQYLNLKMVDYVDYDQIAPDVFRVYIYLKDEYCWGYKVDYSGTSLVVTVKHTPAPAYKGTLAGLTIGVDAGHGGPKSHGAVSPSGVREKDLNLAMTYMLRAELEKRGAKVVLSRPDDNDVAMSDRIKIFANANVDMMVSVHCNAGGNPLRPMGTSTYYKHIEYRELAKTVLERLTELDVNNFGLIGNFNFSLNSPTYWPNILVETMFVSSLPDEELISDPLFQRMMMNKTVKGLEDYMKKVKSSLKKSAKR